jgi:hypothetical protein
MNYVIDIMNYVIPKCDGLPKLEAGLPRDLRACAPRMWAAVEGIVAEHARAGGGMDGLRYRVQASRQTLTARAGQLVVEGLPAFPTAANVTVEFDFVDDGRAVLLFVPRALSGLQRRRTAQLTRLCAGGEREMCQTCEERQRLRACPSCEAVWYCSAECCAADWHVHDRVCAAMHAARKRSVSM